MADFFSHRFNKNVWLTTHARKSMERRQIDESILIEIIEEGQVRHHDNEHLWVFKHISGRTDNLICAAIVEKNALVVKTVMINWELECEK